MEELPEKLILNMKELPEKFIKNKFKPMDISIPDPNTIKVNTTILVYDLTNEDEDREIILPVNGFIDYPYYVKWGDGTEKEIIFNDGYPSRTLTKGKKYRIKIKGKIWRYGDDEIVNSNVYLTEVIKLGATNLSGAFYGATNLVKVPKRLPKGVYDLSDMFAACTNFNYPINNWDTSQVTNMSAMFYNAFNFNQPLDNWNTSSVINMFSMFNGASKFNQPLNKWDTHSVTDMNSMFVGASSFNQLLNNWNVSSVESMRSMFTYATSFNQPINNWDVSSVINTGFMFANATSFNQSLNNWNVLNVNYISYMFANATSFNQPLNNWNVSNVDSMDGMFDGATRFNQPLNNWDVSNVINMTNMFANATSFNQPLNNWDVSGVETMESMFANATSFNQSLHLWNLTNILFSSYMLDYCGMSQYNYQLTLVGWYNIFYPDHTPISFGAKGLAYNSSFADVNTAHNFFNHIDLGDIDINFQN
uniref:BspA family leucine-rich repeat surface protein n=1 Tax=viral metagenome TaxID=1070528 RepID=A0A6C0DYN3_9ZZZZ